MKIRLQNSSRLISAMILVIGIVNQIAFAAGPIDFISAPNRVDMVEDVTRNILYISTSTDGNLLRYELSNRSFMSPIVLGGQTLGMDISPDGNTLAVTNGDHGSTTNWIDLVDLASGGTRRITMPMGFTPEGGTFSVAFTDNQNVLYSMYWGVKKCNLTTSATAEICYYGVPALLAASADHSVVAITAPTSGTRLSRYRVSDGNLANSNVQILGYPSAVSVSRNGQQYSVPCGGDMIFDQNLSQDTSIASLSGMPIGAAYSPTSDTLYLSWKQSGGYHARIDAFDVNTLTEKSVIDSRDAFGWFGIDAASDDGKLRVSSNGSHLFATVDGGINIYAIPEPSTLALLLTTALGGLLWWRRQAKA
jgi:hypothetical protein